MEKLIKKYIENSIEKIYDLKSGVPHLHVEKTKKGISGDYTVVVFPIVKISKKSPEDTAKEIGAYLQSNYAEIDSYNVIKGFLNLTMTSEFWIQSLNTLSSKDFDKPINDYSETYMLEFSSPNTNKPLHLGHIRNNLLGDAVNRIITKAGYKTIKANLINDRGIHICKTILAWMRWGNGKTPESEGIKGDKFVGDFYVLFEKENSKQVNELIEKGVDKKEAVNQTELIIDAREILRKWESGDPEIIKIWKMMNDWVYEGFNKTYNRLGIEFDKIYYESETYIEGRRIVNDGLEKGIFEKHEDNSVWVDVKKKGFEKKLLLRGDGTTVYMTQDIGTAFLRLNEFDLDKILYVVGNEQNYHFNLLREIVAAINPEHKDKIQHISYGMVELPEGKMKSREGKVVDADDLMDEMNQTARKMAEELGKINELSDEIKDKTINMVALSALKYFILKVDPKKNMIFNPKESIDFNGNTGPFIQYTYARIKSIFRKAEEQNIDLYDSIPPETSISEKETNLILLLNDYPTIITDAANEHNPAIIANYIYALTKEYNQFYHDYHILKEKDIKILQLRLALSELVAKTIKSGMELLGIDVPEVM